MSDSNVRNDVSLQASILSKAFNSLERIVCKHLITRIEIEKQLFTLIHDPLNKSDPEDQSLRVIVETEYDILHEDVVIFLVFNGVVSFELERWLHEQLTQHRQKLALDLSGGDVTVDHVSSK